MLFPSQCKWEMDVDRPRRHHIVVSCVQCGVRCQSMEVTALRRLEQRRHGARSSSRSNGDCLPSRGPAKGATSSRNSTLEHTLSAISPYTRTTTHSSCLWTKLPVSRRPSSHLRRIARPPTSASTSTSTQHPNNGVPQEDSVEGSDVARRDMIGRQVLIRIPGHHPRRQWCWQD
jgi:hypothetical protein